MGHVELLLAHVRCRYGQRKLGVLAHAVLKCFEEPLAGMPVAPVAEVDIPEADGRFHVTGVRAKLLFILLGRLVEVVGPFKQPAKLVVGARMVWLKLRYASERSLGGEAGDEAAGLYAGDPQERLGERAVAPEGTLELVLGRVVLLTLQERHALAELTVALVRIPFLGLREHGCCGVGRSSLGKNRSR